MIFAAAYALVFVVNLVPAFMPPSWAVLTFFYVEFGLPLLPLTLGAAMAAGVGRVGLARASRWIRGWVTRGHAEDVAALHDYLERREGGVLWGTFLYSVGPLPTNNLFIAAGIVGVRLSRMFVGFTAAQAISLTFWVWLMAHAVGTLGPLLRPARHGWVAVVAQIASIALALLLLRLPWRRWLLRRLTDAPRTSSR